MENWKLSIRVFFANNLPISSTVWQWRVAAAAVPFIPHWLTETRTTDSANHDHKKNQDWPKGPYAIDDAISSLCPHRENNVKPFLEAVASRRHGNGESDPRGDILSAIFWILIIFDDENCSVSIKGLKITLPINKDVTFGGEIGSIPKDSLW